MNQYLFKGHTRFFRGDIEGTNIKFRNDFPFSSNLNKQEMKEKVEEKCLYKISK